MASPPSYYPSAYQHSSSTRQSSTYYPQSPQQYSPSPYPPSPYSPSPQQYSPQQYSPQPIQQGCSPQYTCLYPGCSNFIFGRAADLSRHQAAVHARETLQLVDCNYTGCHRRGKYGFSRKDKMVDHMREVHKVDIPKRQTGRRDSVMSR